MFENDEINHVEEIIDFFAVFTDDKRYKKIKSKLAKIKKEGRPVRMCGVAQALEEKGIKKGIRKEWIRAIKKMNMPKLKVNLCKQCKYLLRMRGSIWKNNKSLDSYAHRKKSNI